MHQKYVTCLLVFLSLIFIPLPCLSQQEKQLSFSSINWEPYTGENLEGHGVFSLIVTEAFSRVGYDVIYQYRPWSRGLQEAKEGLTDGIMTVYWKKDRTSFLTYPDTALQVTEVFVSLKSNPIQYSGSLDSLKDYTIGALSGSAQAHELKEAGIKVEELSNHELNVKKLLAQRIDAMLIPRSVFFFQLNRISPQFDHTKIAVHQPPYKVYDMYIGISKKHHQHQQIASDFNQGLRMIKQDGTYDALLKKKEMGAK